jgi:hypothetical protein
VAVVVVDLQDTKVALLLEEELAAVVREQAYKALRLLLE